MTHPLETLEGQQAALITRLPNIQHQLTSLLNSEHGDELYHVVSKRLSSGIDVFGHEMFTWTAGDLWQEAIEELADAVLWFLAYMVVDENGPLPPVENPRHDDSPRATPRIQTGTYIRVIQNVLGDTNTSWDFVGKYGVVSCVNSESTMQVRLYNVEDQHQVPMTFWRDELEPVTEMDLILAGVRA